MMALVFTTKFLNALKLIILKQFHNITIVHLTLILFITSFFFIVMILFF
jgi:hypothetical protein